MDCRGNCGQEATAIVQAGVMGLDQNVDTEGAEGQAHLNILEIKQGGQKENTSSRRLSPGDVMDSMVTTINDVILSTSKLLREQTLKILITRN